MCFEEKYFNRAKSTASPIAAARGKRRAPDRAANVAKKARTMAERPPPDEAFVIPSATDDTDWVHVDFLDDVYVDLFFWRGGIVC